jgi:hypothetical protein
VSRPLTLFPKENSAEMSSSYLPQSRLGGALAAIVAVVAALAVLASTATAAPGNGTASILPADHAKGRTLSGQGVKLLAGAGASAGSSGINLPISELETGATTRAGSPAALQFRSGGKSLALTGITFDAATGALAGKLGGKQMPVFRLGAQLAGNDGTVVLVGGKLRLTAKAASAIEAKFELAKKLVHRGVGAAWLDARADKPAPPAAPEKPVDPVKPEEPVLPTTRTVTSGSVDWGVLASFRSYVLGNFGPGSVGTITTAGGATTVGEPQLANSYFDFPASGGTLTEGGGVGQVLTLNTAGSVKFAKPGHCINEVNFSGIEIKLDGAASTLTLDAISEVGSIEGMGCAAGPKNVTDDVLFANLDLSGVSPAATGSSVSWTAIPATLTEAGSKAWGLPQYAPGKVLDPVTISVDLAG